MAYNFSTRPGLPAQFVLHVQANADSYTLTAEFTKHRIKQANWYDPSAALEPVVLSLPVVSNGNEVTINLTAEQVDALGKAYYRIKAVKDGRTLYVEGGRVDVYRRPPVVEVRGDELYVMDPGGGQVLAGPVGGPQGAPGIQGLKGDKGDTGPANTLTIGSVTTGSPGSAASADIHGEAPNQILDLSIPHGEKGDRGFRGDKGDPGQRGPVGFQGQQGIQGPVGPAGLEWRGTWNPVFPYAIDDAVYYDGYAWFAPEEIGAGIAPSLAFDNPWQPLAARGAQGIQGPQGIQGIQGIQGFKGDKGDRGALAVGTVTTVAAGSPATVTNVGNINDAIFNFGIPQGIQGIQGIQGVKGDPGDLTPSAPSGVSGAVGTSITSQFPSTRRWTLTGNIVVTVPAAPPSPDLSGTSTLVIAQAPTGGPYTVTWGVATGGKFRWAGGAPAPVMPTTSTGRMTVHLFWTGAEWIGFVAEVTP